VAFCRTDLYFRHRNTRFLTVYLSRPDQQECPPPAMVPEDLQQYRSNGDPCVSRIADRIVGVDPTDPRTLYAGDRDQVGSLR